MIAEWQTGLFEKGWLGLFFNNHDLPRMISNFGDQNYWLASGKTLSLTLHILQGTPFIYQGEEIGMTNCQFNDLDEHDDIEIHQMYQAMTKANPSYTKAQHLAYVAKMNRDNARTPMQWSKANYAGFTTNQKSWIKVNPNYKNINVETALNDPNSLFYWYQKLIALRKANRENDLDQILINGSFELIDPNHHQIFAYKRIWNNQQLIMIANWSDQTVDYQFDANQIILNTHKEIEPNQLKPWQAILIYQKF